MHVPVFETVQLISRIINLICLDSFKSGNQRKPQLSLPNVH